MLITEHILQSNYPEHKCAACRRETRYYCEHCKAPGPFRPHPSLSTERAVSASNRSFPSFSRHRRAILGSAASEQRRE